MTVRQPCFMIGNTVQCPQWPWNVMSSWSNIVLFMKIVSVINVIDAGDIIYTLLFPAMFNMAIKCIDSSSKMIIDTLASYFNIFIKTCRCSEQIPLTIWLTRVSTSQPLQYKLVVLCILKHKVNRMLMDFLCLCWTKPKIIHLIHLLSNSFNERKDLQIMEKTTVELSNPSHSLFLRICWLPHSFRGFGWVNSLK